MTFSPEELKLGRIVETKQPQEVLAAAIDTLRAEDCARLQFRGGGRGARGKITASIPLCRSSIRHGVSFS